MKKILSFALIFIILISFSYIGFAQTSKDETIYVNLDYDGTPNNIKVVNRIWGSNNEKHYIDYGKYDHINILVDNVHPIIDENKIKWPTEYLEKNDIYYEGSINKELPMKIKIKYFLDNKEILGEDLAGKSGNLKINISIEDSSDLTTQIQLPLSLDMFSDIKVENGIGTVVGKTMTVVFNHLPIGNGSFSIEAKGENIELEPILISSTNSDFPLPEDIEKDINEFSSGVGQMSKAFDKLEKGSKEITKGTISLGDGLKSLNSGISRFFSSIKEIVNNSKSISKGLEDFTLGLKTFKDNSLSLTLGIEELNLGINNLSKESIIIKEGLQGLNRGTQEIKKGFDGLSNGLNSLNSEHEKLVALAKSLSSSTDPRVKALAQGVIAEGEAIKSLSEGATESNKSLNLISENTFALYQGYEKYDEGLNIVKIGFNTLNEQLQPLPEQLNQMYNGHLNLTNGAKTLFDGLELLEQGVSQLDNKTKTLPNEVNKLAEGQKEITNGITTLNEEGIKKIEKTTDRFSIVNTNKDKNNKLTSFVDNKNNNSTCQFLMKTPSIKSKEKEITNLDKNANLIEKQNFFQRFLALFKK